MRTILIAIFLTVAFPQVLLAQEPEWSIEGRSIGMDNCSVGCPCIFGEKPTHGRCEHFSIYIIEKGNYDNLSLTNTMYAMGGAMGRPNAGAQQQYDFVAYYIDASAKAEQKEALKKILASKQFEMFGKPVEVKDAPIKVSGMEGFGHVGKTYQGTVGNIARVQITPISGAIKDKPLIVENSAEPMFYWTALGKTSDSYYKSAGVDWKFTGTSGESSKFSIKSSK